LSGFTLSPSKEKVEHSGSIWLSRYIKTGQI